MTGVARPRADERRDVVTITGTNLYRATAVKFGATAATSFTVDSADPDHRDRAGRRGDRRRHRHHPAGGTRHQRARQIHLRRCAHGHLRQPRRRPVGRREQRHDHRHGLTGATAVEFGGDRGDLVHGRQRDPDHRHRARGRRDRRCHRHDPAGGTSADRARQIHLRRCADRHLRQPERGPAAGGTSVVITGTHLTGATAVKFGATAASVVHGQQRHPDHRHRARRLAGPSTSPPPPRRRHHGHEQRDKFTYTAARPSPPSAQQRAAGRRDHRDDHRHRPDRRDRSRVRIHRGDLVHRQQRHPDHRHLPRRRPGPSTSPSPPRGRHQPPVAATSTPTRRAHGHLASARRRAAGRRDHVTITGTGLTGATAVKFGATAATSFTVDTATQITATAPAGSPDRRHHRHDPAGGTSATGHADKYTYTARPPSRHQPDGGPLAGGDHRDDHRHRLTGATAVKFGSTAATSFTVNSATQITATSPAGAGHRRHHRDHAAGGTSATSAGDQFTYTAADGHRGQPEQRARWPAGPPSRSPAPLHRRDRGQVRLDGGKLVHGQQRDPDHRHRPGRAGDRRRHRHDPGRRHQPDQRRTNTPTRRPTITSSARTAGRWAAARA